MFRKLLDEIQAGDNVGVLLEVDKDEVERGQVLAKPGSITPHTEFMSNVYILSKDEGGRHTPFFDGYKPQFYFRTTDVTGVAHLPEGVEMVMPGDNVEMRVSSTSRSRWRRASASRSAKAAARSAPAGHQGREVGIERGGGDEGVAGPKIRSSSGVRPPDAGRRGARHRRARDADRRQGRGTRPAAHRAVDLHRDPLAPQVQGLANFQMLTHKRLIDIVDATSKTVQELQRLNLSAGVDIEIKL